ncbi:MAG: hypothetical protein EYX74_07560 [Desulfobulbaceae bacterium]|nr:MAG: hypothetical protein EYX74_07560 [Desulfobulbaceae bacterium]
MCCPNQEVLAQRLAAQSEELVEVRRHLAHYHDLIEALQERIEMLRAASPSEQLAALAEFLDAGLAGVLGSEEPADTLTEKPMTYSTSSPHT